MGSLCILCLPWHLYLKFGLQNLGLWVVEVFLVLEGEIYASALAIWVVDFDSVLNASLCSALFLIRCDHTDDLKISMHGRYTSVLRFFWIFSNENSIAPICHSLKFWDERFLKQLEGSNPSFAEGKHALQPPLCCIFDVNEIELWFLLRLWANHPCKTGFTIRHTSPSSSIYI